MKGRGICSTFLLLVAIALIAPVALADSVAIQQVDWFGGATGVPLMSNSDWGYCAFDFTPTTSIRYLNIVAPDNGGTNQWLAQNVPILDSAASPNPPSHGINLNLSLLGVNRGDPAAGRSFFYTVGGFQTAMPTSGSSGSVGSANVRMDYGYDFMDNGADLNTPTVPTDFVAASAPRLVDPGPAPGRPAPQTPPLPQIPIYRVERDKMRSVEQDVNGCAPGAAANSIWWLHEEYGLPLPGEPSDQWLYYVMRSKMKTGPKGTKIADFLAAKQEYLGPKGLVLKEKRGKVTWEWLEREIDHGEDVELVYAWWGLVEDETGKKEWRWVNHMVTIQGKYDDGFNRWLKIRDDSKQGENGGTERPRWTKVGSQYPGYLSLLNEADYTYVWFAHSESVPEPSALVVLGSGLIGLIGVLKRSRR